MMTPGSYRVSFVVDLTDCNSKEEAFQAIAAMVGDMLDEDNFPDLELELVEELDIEYQVEEDEVPELNFEV
jgi:hypothetical protein